LDEWLDLSESTPLTSRYDFAQRLQERITVDVMFAASVFDGVEASDRAADASHLEVDKNADGRREILHNVINQVVKADQHGRIPTWIESLMHRFTRSLFQHNHRGDILAGIQG
jgi:hypothetical protein